MPFNAAALLWLSSQPLLPPVTLFEVQPRQCVTHHQQCQTQVLLRWQLATPQPVCLHIVQQPEQRVCLQSPQITQWQGVVQSDKSVEIRLLDAKQQQVLAVLTVQVLRSPKRHVRRSAAWSVF